MKDNEILNDLIQQIDHQKIKVASLKQLPESLLKTAPDNSWNILQCIEHMSISTELYLHQFDKKIASAKPAKNQYKPTFLAKKLVQSSIPQEKNELKYKMKTMKKLEPGIPSEIQVREIERLENNLSHLTKIVESMKSKDLRSFKVTSAIGPLLKLYAGDALFFISAHNERHLTQIDNIHTQIKHP